MELIQLGITRDHSGARPVFVHVYDLNEAPDGRIDECATTAPKGTKWMNNGKSRFGGEFRQWLVVVDPDLWIETKKRKGWI